MDITNKKKKESSKKDAYFLVDYDTESGSNIKLYFHVGNNNGDFVESIDEVDIPNNRKVYRVSDKDAVVLFTKQHAKRTSKKKAYMKAIGGQPAVVKGLRSDEVYVTNNKSTRLDNIKNRVSPFNILVDKYLKDKKLFGRTGHQTVVSVVLRGDNNVVLSWLKSPIGEYVKDAYTVLIFDELDDEDELKSSVFESFKSKTNITLNENDDNIRYEIITELELLDYTSDSKADLYPIEEEFFKIRKDLVSAVIIGASIIGSGATFTYSEALHKQERQLLKEYRTLQNSKPDVDEFRKNKIRNHVSFFIENRNIDFQDALTSSEELWIKNSRIDLISERSGTSIRLFSVESDSYIPEIFVDKLHSLEAPEGYKKEDIIAHDNYTAFEVAYKK